MSLWRHGDLEVDIDFTDADFLDALEDAKRALEQEAKDVPVVGKASDIVRAQIGCFDRFFDRLFGSGAGEKIRCGRNSLEMSLDAVDSINAFYDKEDKRFGDKYAQYNVQQHGNRAQRRNYNKQNRSNSYKNRNRN